MSGCAGDGCDRCRGLGRRTRCCGRCRRRGRARDRCGRGWRRAGARRDQNRRDTGRQRRAPRRPWGRSDSEHRSKQSHRMRYRGKPPATGMRQLRFAANRRQLTLVNRRVKAGSVAKTQRRPRARRLPKSRLAARPQSYACCGPVQLGMASSHPPSIAFDDWLATDETNAPHGSGAAPHLDRAERRTRRHRLAGRMRDVLQGAAATATSKARHLGDQRRRLGLHQPRCARTPVAGDGPLV